MLFHVRKPSGTHQGAGATVVNGALLLGGSGLKNFRDSRTVTANAGGSWTGTGDLRFWNTASLNTTAGTFVIQNDETVSNFGNGSWNNTTTVARVSQR